MALRRPSSAAHGVLLVALLLSRFELCRPRPQGHTRRARVEQRSLVVLETIADREPTVSVRPAFHQIERARVVIDATRVVDSGRRRKLVRGQWLDASHVFTSPLAAVAKVRDRWLFALADGAVFEADDFLSVPRRVGEIAGGALVASTTALSCSLGRLAVVDVQRRLWIVDERGVIASPSSVAQTRVVSAAFETDLRGAVLTEWGHIFETTDGGATFRERSSPTPNAIELRVDHRRLAVQPEEGPALWLDGNEPPGDERAAGEADTELAECSNDRNRWLAEERGPAACEALSAAFRSESDRGLGTWFYRWGSSVLVETNGFRYAQEWTRATLDARGQWRLSDTIEVDGGAVFRTRLSADGRTTLTVGRCERDAFAEPLHQLALCWREFDARALRRHATLDVPPRSRLVHGFGAIGVVLSEDQRSLRVLDFASRTSVERSAAALAPALRDARITHVHTLLPSGRSYAVVVGADGSARLRMDLDRDDGTSVRLPTSSLDAALDERGRTLAAGASADRIWRRASERDRWERVELLIDAEPSRVEIDGVRCDGSACSAGAFEIPWRDQPASVQWIGARGREAAHRGAPPRRWEFTTVACEDRDRIYSGERIALREEDAAEGARYVFGPGSWATVRLSQNGLQFSWAERYRNAAWRAHGRASSALEIATEQLEDADDQNRVLAMSASGLLVRFGETVGWIAANGGASRVLRPRRAIAVAVVHEAGFALLRSDAKVSLYNLRGELQAERRVEQPVGAPFSAGLARIASRWGVVTADPTQVERARFTDAQSGAVSSIEWKASDALRVCETPARDGADFVRMRLFAGLETREQYVRQTSMSLWWADEIDRPVATIEIEHGQPCVRSIALVGQWDEGSWVGSRGGVIADSAVTLSAAPGQRLVGYDIARGDTALVCTVRGPQGVRLSNE